MISNVNMSTYYEVARIRQYLNRFIHEASIAKSQINISKFASFSSFTGIGNNIDVLAWFYFVGNN